jgi:DNA repair protein RecN (Recombination protein N)
VPARTTTPELPEVLDGSEEGERPGRLTELRIRGLGAIDDVTLEFGGGLTVVTGETGAGKTMVVTGLTLLFGGRADPGRVRAVCFCPRTRRSGNARPTPAPTRTTTAA